MSPSISQQSRYAAAGRYFTAVPFDKTGRYVQRSLHYIRLAVLSVLPMYLAACATVLHGTTEQLDVTASADGKQLAGAICVIKRGDQETWTVTTPGKIEVPRAKEDLRISCAKNGYRMPTEADIKPECGALGSAGGGALAGAALGATATGVALFPVLAIPGAGWVVWPLAVGGGALVGGAASAATDTADGAAYSYPTPIIIPMKRVTPQEEKGLTAAPCAAEH